MIYERLSEWLPQLPLAMLLGLILSFCFRRQPWAALIWVPTMVSLVAIFWLVLGRVLRQGSLRGPDAGWGAFELIILAPVLGICAVGLIACYFGRPRSWDWRTLLPAIGLSITALGYIHLTGESLVTIRLVDIYGKPISGANLSFNNAPREGSSGVIEFKLRRGRSRSLEIFPAGFPSKESGDVPVNHYNLGFQAKNADSSKLEVQHSWARPIGVATRLHEMFIETIPFARHLEMTVVLPPQNSLALVPDRETLRQAFDVIDAESGHGDPSYGYVCRNLGAIQFLPELVGDYGGNRQRQFTVMEGLKAIAGTLSDLDEGCRSIRNASVRKNSSLAQYGGQIAALCAWAGVDYEDSHPSESLDRVQQKLLELSRPLVDFCLAKRDENKSPPWILAELGMLNRPHLQELVARLMEDPPTDIQQAHSWSRVFHRMNARQSELRELIESPNPLLQAAARDARTD